MTPPLPAWSQTTKAAEGTSPDVLPSGADSQFRSRMLTWAAPAATAAPQEVDIASPVSWLHLSSSFGPRSDPFHATEAFHRGIDIPGALGTPVFASADGIAIDVGTGHGYGRLIEIDHGNGLETRYAHLSRTLVRPNSFVRRGQIIGLIGSTGRSTGNHLHFEVRVDGQAADPLPYLMGLNIDTPAYEPTPEKPFRSSFAQARDGSAAQSPR